KEKNLSFDENILKTPSDVYLEGYWQTEKYFKEISDILRKEFTFKIPPSEANQRMLDTIRLHNSVSIHIRRTDYITDPASSKDMGFCDIPYYKRAVSYLAERVADPHFYVFSDDMNWVRSNFALNFPVTYVDLNNADTNYEDMRLMSSCKHNIIANSTFSWWGAWLNSSEKKIVIAPKKWFNDTSKKSTDLVPENWIKL
ncbi:MAG: alpha-1,2-fucosyltransferase, partial [Chitinophagaceae bacterium]|nr:alpha-1,2-fucosyltransferase [Chitinophagaceae bacterium]